MIVISIVVPLEAESLVLFHCKIVHDFGPNHPDRPEYNALCMYNRPTARYMPG